jgi:lipopolysaccharide/colanic/teichoic acid biosynthesis glycosyltransferase
MRVGLNGKLFGYLKFRTMRVEATELSTGPVFQLDSDPRITRLGVFLRRTSIDELPALFNVISGDMSIVGPRAALPLEVEHYSEKQRKRLELKPGLTGYWQVFGREKEKFTFDEMIAMDLEYLDKHSLLLDLKILVCTVVMALRSRSAY